MHSSQQFFFASKYLAEFWPEAQKDLESEDARFLIWTPLFTCTESYIAPELVQELRAKFRNMYGMKSQVLQPTN
jgi:hypothetical protein